MPAHRQNRLSFHTYISLPSYYIKMGKKITPVPSGDGSKGKRIRSRHKQLFPELATHQQQLVQRHSQTRRSLVKRVIAEDSEEQVELDVLENDNNDLDTICDTVHRLLSKNKVSAKNAFDVPLIDLEQLPDFMGSLENEYAWKKLSSTLENDYRIYAYRVDAIHSITYNILHTMSRRQQDIDALQNPPAENAENAGEAQMQQEAVSDGAEGEHLERRVENLNLTEFDLALGVDPILQRNKRKFDQLGAQNMLINSLSMDDQLALELVKDTTTIKKFPPWGDYTDIWKADDPLMAFIELANFRAQISEALDGKMREEEVFNLFTDEKENFYDENYRNMEIEKEVMNKQKDIAKEIKWKSKHVREFEVNEEADNWMEDRGIFGKKGKEVMVRSEVRNENPEDLVNFQLNVGAEEDTRFSVFLKENDKAEFKEEIQDKFLLVKRPTSTFEISKYPLTLKQNPKPVQVDIPRQSADVDVRRQLISISQAKKKMKDLIHSRSTFKTLYGGYKQFQDISPALCFLTMLHLANENGLSLDQIDEANFYIR